MKNKIFKFIVVAMLGVSISGCGLFRKTPREGDNTAMYAQTVMYNARQLDSMCTVDGISANLQDWANMFYYDEETKERIDRYTFVKVMNENEEMVYILTPKDTLYKITKRYVKEAEEE